MHRALMNFNPESIAFGQETFESGETTWSNDAQESEAFRDAEMELAASLLEVTTESGLEGFVGTLIRSAGKGVGPSTAHALSTMLKQAATQTLPFLGRAIGAQLPQAPDGALISQVPEAAGRYFGLELEGLSPEDQEFEVARSFVRFAREAAKNAAAAPLTSPAQSIAQAAAVQAARRHAPGLFRAPPTNHRVSSMPRAIPCQSGRWVREGRNIIVLFC
jgi:hypothetical protein